MSLPLVDKIKKYIEEDYSRFHVPGHKGLIKGHKEFSPLLQYDLTEIPEMDSLYHADGIINELENKISQFYGSKSSIISCGGSTLSIMTMLKLVASENDKVIMGRNAHVSAINAAALIGFDPVWIYPDYDFVQGLPSKITPQSVKQALQDNPDAKAIYITSPDYYGVMSDIKTISSICKEYGKPLLVDNAHGAHLPLVGDSHPIKLGASMCADSAHKTLPTLTGSAFLHINDNLYVNTAKSVMSVFGSTSPSYLMMASIDLCIDYVNTKGKLEYSRLGQRIYDLRKLGMESGFSVIHQEIDPIRFSVSAQKLGYTGQELNEFFEEFKIMPEYVGPNYVVLVPTPNNSENDFWRLERALLNIYPARVVEKSEYNTMVMPEKCITIREAFMSQNILVDTKQAVGRIAAESKAPCPPGVPLVMAGEKISADLANMLFSYGVLDIKVVK